MPRNNFLDTLGAVNNLTSAANRAASIYQEVNQANQNRQLRRAKIETERKLNEVQEEITADPDFYKSVDQIYDEQGNNIPKVHPHDFDQKYENWWTGGVSEDYWKQAGQSGVTGRSQQIFDEVKEKYITDEQAAQEFELWYMEMSEQMRHGLTEMGYQRKSEKMVLDLQDTLNNKLLKFSDDRRAISLAQEEVEDAVSQRIISAEDGQQYLEDFKTQKLFNSARETAVDILYDNGYDAARKFAMKDDLPITEEGRSMLFDFLEKQYKKWDESVRRNVDEAETEFINAWTGGNLSLSNIVNDPRLARGHSYANDVRMRWIKRIKSEQEAADEGKMNPNDISDPAAEEAAQDLYNDPYVSEEKYKEKVRSLEGLSKDRLSHWLDKSGLRDSRGIINTVYTEAIENIDDHYNTLMEDTKDPQERSMLNQERLKRKEQLQDLVSSGEYQELAKKDDTVLAKISENLIAEKIQYSIDSITGYDSFKINDSMWDSMGWNDVEKFTRNIQSGDLYGVEERYEEALIRYEKGIRKLGGDVFQKPFALHREKGGNFIFFFESDKVKEGDTYLTPNYHGKSGYMIQFRANEDTKDIEPQIWNPDFGTWREIPQYLQDWLDPPDEEDIKDRERVEETKERLESGWTPMGG